MMRQHVEQVGYRQVADVEQRAKKSGEECDFGGDEPDHAEPEGSILLILVGASQALGDHGAEPAEQHVENDAGAGQHRPLAKAELIDLEDEAERQQKQAAGQHDRVVRGLRDEIGVMRGIVMCRGGVAHG